MLPTMQTSFNKRITMATVSLFQEEERKRETESENTSENKGTKIT